MIDLTLGEDAREIVSAATDVLARVAPLDRFRQANSEPFLGKTLADWGWFAMGLPADRGGLEIGPAEAALINLEAGRRLVSPSVLATALVVQFGPEEFREDLLSGAARAAFAIAEHDDDHFCIDRRDARLLIALAGDELLIFRSADFTGAPVDAFDESLEVEKGRFGGDPLMVSGAGQATLLLAALLAGTAAGAADVAIEYAKVREQFGQPIGVFQAVKHRCADMGVAAFAAEAQVTLAAAALAEHAPIENLELAAAAWQAIRAARSNGAAGVQVHGGMGFTQECHAHRFLKRGHVLTRLIGGESRFASELLLTG